MNRSIGIRLVFFCLFCSCFTSCFSQPDSIFRIGLILPLQTASAIQKLDDYSNAQNFFTAHNIRLDEDVIIGLDFYQGVLEALAETTDSVKIELSVFDNWNSDSVTEVILKQKKLKQLDLIIGSVSTSSARMVADFCLRNKIVNVQPFSPSKSLTANNPYHLKIAPTIDAHVDAMFNSMVDSLAGANVVIYTPDAEISTAIAHRFDSLLRNYNASAENKFSVTVLNIKNMLANGKKTTLAAQVKPNRQNVVVISSFNEAFINESLRVLREKSDQDSTLIVYGMPTWRTSNVLRLDYVNYFHTRVTDNYNPDRAPKDTSAVYRNFLNNFSDAPTRYAYLGFDVTNFLIYNLSTFGTGFLDYISTQHYNGVVYQFDIFKNMSQVPTIDYYENRNVNVFMTDNYTYKTVY